MSDQTAPKSRLAQADVLQILGDVAGGKKDLDRNHAKAIVHAMKAGAVTVSGSYTPEKI